MNQSTYVWWILNVSKVIIMEKLVTLKEKRPFYSHCKLRSSMNYVDFCFTNSDFKPIYIYMLNSEYRNFTLSLNIFLNKDGSYGAVVRSNLWFENSNIYSDIVHCIFLGLGTPNDNNWEQQTTNRCIVIHHYTYFYLIKHCIFFQVTKTSDILITMGLLNVSKCIVIRIWHAMKSKILSYGCISLRGV